MRVRRDKVGDQTQSKTHKMPDPTEALACFISTARAIAGPTEYELVLQNFAECLRSLIPHDHLDIVLLHGEGTQICYEAGLTTAWGQVRSDPSPTESSPIRGVLRGDAPYFLTDDAWEDDRFHFEGADDRPIFDADLHSRIVVPLRVQGDIIGSLAISSHEIGVYDSELVDVAQGAADLVSAYLFALERGKEARDAAVAEADARNAERTLRLGAQRLTEGMERERQRLGMDLHDQTLADLARLTRRVSSLRRRGRFDGDELLAVEKDLETCLNDLRGIVEDMKPGVLQMFGFSDAVEAHISRCIEHGRVECEARVQDATAGQIDHLSEAVRTSLFRIVQEAVTNALKHSGASEIVVDIIPETWGLTIQITDNGTGIDLENLQFASGIDNIRTRAALISARATVEPLVDGQGTRVAILLPIRPGS